MKRRCGVKQGLRNRWFHLQNEIKTRWGDSKNEIGFDVYEHVVVHYLGSTYDSSASARMIYIYIVDYSRIKTSRQGNRQMADKVTEKNEVQNEIKTRSGSTPTRHPTSHCRNGQVLGTSPKS